MGKFNTVFEISNKYEGPDFIIYVGIFLFVFSIIIYLYEFYRKTKIVKKYYLLIFFLFGAFSIYIYPNVERSKKQSNDLYNAYLNEKYNIIEGKVKVLRKQPKAGRAPGDLIKIEGIEFVIDNFLAGNYYTKTIAYGGHLKDGVTVRLYYIGNKILRIDVYNEEI